MGCIVWIRGQSRLNIFTLYSPVSSRIMCFLNVSKSISSTPTYSIGQIHKLSFKSGDFDDKSTSSDIRISFQVQKPQKPTRGDPHFSESNIVDKLLAFADDPVYALLHYKEARKRMRLTIHVRDSFFAILHILVRSQGHHGVARSLIKDYLSSDTAPSGDALIDGFIICSQTYGLQLKQWIFHYFLHAYTKAGRHKDAEDCFYVLISRGLVQNTPTFNVLLKSLLKARMFTEVHRLFRDVSEKLQYDCESVYMIMCALLREGKMEDAHDCFLAAKERGIKLNARVYSTAVRAACMRMETEIAFGLLNEMKGRKWIPYEGTYTLLICAFVKQQKMEDALKLKDEMIACGYSVNLVVATSLMKGYNQLGDLHSSLTLFNEIVEAGKVPNKVTYAVIIEGCCSNGNLQRAKELYEQMRSSGIQPCAYVLNSLIRGYLRSNLVDKANELMNEVVKDGYANVSTYNYILLWFCQHHRLDDAYVIWDKMVNSGIKPNAVSYGILIHGCFKKHEVEKALALLDNMQSSELSPSDAVFNTVISGLCRVGRAAAAKEIMGDFVNIGFNPSCMTYNSLIDGLMKEGNLETSLVVYKDMLGAGISPSIITFTTLIDGFSKNGSLDLAVKMHERLRTSVPVTEMDLNAYNVLIDSLCKKQDTDSARRLFEQIKGIGLSPNTVLYNTMIAGYRDLYEIKGMLQLYERMKKEGVHCDFATYTTLMDGLMNVGNTERALELYQQMVSENVEPDAVTYSVLVNGLCSKKRTESARMLIDDMLRRHITPTEHVFNTLVACYFREGNLLEAFKLHDEMCALGLVPKYDILDYESILNPRL